MVGFSEVYRNTPPARAERGKPCRHRPQLQRQQLDDFSPGRAVTGQRVSHFIAAGGAFARVCAALRKSGVELWDDEATRKKKAASKTRYTCPDCGVSAWAKPGVQLVCGDCDMVLEEGG